MNEPTQNREQRDDSSTDTVPEMHRDTDEPRPAGDKQRTVGNDHATDSERRAPRIVSIDAYRGIVMSLMVAELMHLNRLADSYPDSTWLEALRFHTSHVPWQGGSLHDMIQPSFTFLVGVAMPFSIASRQKRGSGRTKLFLHAVWRALVLILMGVWLRSLGQEQTYWTFEDTLTQIGLGYPFVFLLAFTTLRFQSIAFAGLMIGFWAMYAVLPAPPIDFDYAAVGVPADWPHHLEGFASRWNMNANLSWRFDVWFLNLFPRESPFEFNGGGYSTLSFVPTMGTMILGLLAGGWMRDERRRAANPMFLWLTASACFGCSLLLIWTGLCPNVKKIWTPTFVFYSGGWCFLALALLHWICDQKRWQRWTFPFLVVGANSILIYVFSWTIAHPIRDMLYRHFGHETFEMLGKPLAPVLSGAVTMAILFWMLLWLYRRRVFIKI